MIPAIQACLNLLPGRLRLAWLGLIPILTIGALAELIAAAALLRVIAGMVDAAPPALPSLGASALPANPVSGVVALGALFLLKNLWLAASHILQTRLLAHSIAAAFRKVIGGWLSAPYALEGRGTSSDLIHDATEGLTLAFRSVMASAATLLSELLVLAAITLLLVWTSPRPVIGAAALLALVLVIFLSASRRATERWGAAGFELGRKVVEEVQQIAAGLRDIKSFRRERYFLDHVTSTHASAMRAFQNHTSLAGMPRLLIETVFIWAAVAVLVSSRSLSSRPADVVPLFALFAYAGFRIIPSVNRIIFTLDLLRHGAAGMRRLWDHIRPIGFAEPGALVAERRELSRGLDVAGVSHRHAGASEPSLQDVSFSVCRGDAVGLVGPTGAGKSTLLEILAGVLEPHSGDVRVDGVALNEWLSGGGLIGYVPQSPFLLNDTIARNVAFGVVDVAIDRTRAERALAVAALDQVVRESAAGLDTVTGEGGSRLSGGERQRLAIARAVYHEPQLLLLDEATSALDAATEGRVIENLRSTGITTIVVGHRLHALRFCSSIVLLDQGKMIAEGSWDELHERQPLFRMLTATRHDPATQPAPASERSPESVP